MSVGPERDTGPAPPGGAPPLSEPAPQALAASWGPQEAVVGFFAVIGFVLVGSVLLVPIAGDDGLDLTLGSQAILELSLVSVALLYGRSWTALGLRRPRPGWVKTAALGYAVYFAAVLAIVMLIGDPEQTDVADELGFDENIATAIVAGLLIVLIVPFCEELFFRGFFYGGLRRRLSFPVATCISALLFGAVHLGPANLVAGLQLAIFGIVLAVVYERTGSLWANIALHIGNNALAFALLVSS